MGQGGGHVEIYSQGGEGEMEPLLSWCISRSIEGREMLAHAYANLVGLDTHELAWLLEDVTHNDSLHQDCPLVGS